MNDQRAYERFNVYVVGEFSSTPAAQDSFFGITRDFSCGGMSFESKNLDLAPGDRLQVKFKHPRIGSDVCSTGHVVWKRKEHRYSSLAGIRFLEDENSPDSSILQLMSESGDVPLDAFLSKAYTGIMAQYTRAAEQAAPNIHDHAAPQAEHRAAEEVLVPDDLQHRKQVTHDDSVIPGGVQHEETAPRRGWMYLLVLLAASVLFIFAFPLRFDNVMHILSTPVHDEPETKPVLKILTEEVADPEGEGDAGGETGEPTEGRDVTVLEFTEQAREAPGGDEIILPGEAVRQGREVGDGNYYIQVGSWKNPVYAMQTLKKLIDRYPEAFIAHERGFSKVRIPDIPDLAEGHRVMKDVENTLSMTPLIVKKAPQ